MAVINDASTNWSAGVLLTEDEVWQAQSGWFRVSTEASPAEDDGIILRGDRGDAVTISSGKTVKYKLMSGQTPIKMTRTAV